MRVLFINRSDCFTKSGGDTVQMLKTKEYLEKIGVAIDIVIQGTPAYEKYDLVHIFNIQNASHSLAYMRSAKKAGKKTLLSTIYWNLDALYREDFRTNPRFALPRLLLGRKLSDAFLSTYLNRIRRKQARILALADILLPNSKTEGDKLVEDFSLKSTSKIWVVPNAVDAKDFLHLDGQKFREKIGVDRYILCVARIQRAKNQLNLIRASKRLKLPLVLIGNTGEEDYFNSCKKEAENAQVIFLPFMQHEEIKHALAGAICHALPSLRETPGLSSLEAAMCQCPVVTGTEGSQREYFRDFAYYCDSHDIGSIANAIMRASAMSAEKKAEFQLYVQKNYVWEITAKKTLEAYVHLLSDNIHV